MYASHIRDLRLSIVVARAFVTVFPRRRVENVGEVIGVKVKELQQGRDEGCRDTHERLYIADAVGPVQPAEAERTIVAPMAQLAFAPPAV